MYILFRRSDVHGMPRLEPHRVETHLSRHCFAAIASIGEGNSCMKLRHPWMLKIAGFVGAWALCAWMRTLRYRYRSLGRSLDPGLEDHASHYIYAMWHENLLLPIYRFAAPNIAVLISQHADGQIIADICQSLKVNVVRGSTTRGGVNGLRNLLRAGQVGHLALTPDGPRGPRQHVKLGLVYLAARLGLPIVPVGFGYKKAWRFKSWDRFALPRPWTRATCVSGLPIAVPAGADRAELEAYRLQVEEALVGVNEAAGQWAETGHWLSPDALKQLRSPRAPAPAPVQPLPVEADPLTISSMP
jgi:lysophospholipid acyltransferase (LPLAT)-like uncharacterized protein